MCLLIPTSLSLGWTPRAARTPDKYRQLLMPTSASGRTADLRAEFGVGFLTGLRERQTHFDRDARIALPDPACGDAGRVVTGSVTQCSHCDRLAHFAKLFFMILCISEVLWFDAR